MPWRCKRFFFIFSFLDATFFKVLAGLVLPSLAVASFLKPKSAEGDLTLVVYDVNNRAFIKLVVTVRLE
jgi:hypothetical protein